MLNMNGAHFTAEVALLQSQMNNIAQRNSQIHRKRQETETEMVVAPSKYLSSHQGSEIGFSRYDWRKLY